ncbi:MAG TPA: methyltransferase domain-containing protein [Caulobacteraceae bacterium]|nr:methyltransferase domain-containing protein [Caulobacteraceae bacterium]
MPEIAKSFGRQAFGDDPANYDASRPDYPDWVYDTLRDRCGLGPGCAAFEIGPGTGIATRRLLSAGARVTAVEPDPRLAGYLRTNKPNPALTVVNAPFETAELPVGAFDLGVAFTSFHWVDELAALNKIATLLRPGAWWAMVWNVFGDDDLPDPFHEATFDLLKDGPRSPGNAGRGGIPYALQENARLSAFGRAAAYTDLKRELSTWELVLDPDQVVRLYATYSDMTARPLDEQREVLAQLRAIAAAPPFNGRVVRNMVTVLYTARRR